MLSWPLSSFLKTEEKHYIEVVLLETESVAEKKNGDYSGTSHSVRNRETMYAMWSTNREPEPAVVDRLLSPPFPFLDTRAVP